MKPINFFAPENKFDLHKHEECELALPFIDQIVTDHRALDDESTSDSTILQQPEHSVIIAEELTD